MRYRQPLVPHDPSVANEPPPPGVMVPLTYKRGQSVSSVAHMDGVKPVKENGDNLWLEPARAGRRKELVPI